MKKFFLIFAVTAMVVLDLILSGESVFLGLILLTGVALASYGLDQAHQASNYSDVESDNSKQEMPVSRYNLQLTSK